MKFFNLFLLFGLFSLPLMAQEPLREPATATAKISGVLLDSLTKRPIEFANVALFRQADQQLVDGIATDDKGKFELSNLAPGEYVLECSFLGFDSKALRNLSLRPNQKVDLGNIVLSPTATKLAEVTVSGARAMIEEKVDRLIYNADKDVTGQGGDATDLLRKVPLLSVDMDGNVSLRGNANIRVLINNKPSTILAANLADALKQIPAEMIKSVEVITAPSARYDAEGSGGIINIITKKNTLRGLTLNVNTGIGNRGSNLGLNGSLRTGKMGFSLGGYGRANYFGTLSDFRQSTVVNGMLTNTVQAIDAFDTGLGGNYTLGWDYDISKKQSIAASVRFGVRNSILDQDLQTDIFRDDLLTSSSFRHVDVRNLSNSIDVNLDYIHVYGPRHEWSFASQLSRNNLTNDFVAELFAPDQTIDSRQKNLNDNTNQEITVQTDYSLPLGENQAIEIGAKGIFREVISEFQYLSGQGATGEFSLDLSRPAGLLNYDQNIAAGYLAYTLSTKNKYTFKLGSRYEYTSIEAKDQREIPFVIPSYDNLVPSVNISKSIGNTTLKTGYNYRIQRPGLQQLNPNFNAANPQNITIGNPNLNPELTHNMELGFSTRFKKSYLNVALFGRLSNNIITQIRQPSDTLTGAIITTFENIGKQRALGTNVFGNVYLTSNWSINGGFDLFYVFLEGRTAGLNGLSELVSNAGFNLNGRLSTNLTLKEGWSLELGSFMRGRQVQLQGIQGGFGRYSLGVRKEFANKRGNVGFSTENFLSRGITVRTELQSPTFSQFNETLQINRGFRLNLSYRIGKMSFEEPRSKTRSVNNDDVKSSGEDNNNNGGGNGGGRRSNNR